MQNLPDELIQLFASVHPTGSAYICDPPVVNTDSDWVGLLPEDVDLPSFVKTLLSLCGWTAGGSIVASGRAPLFASLRQGSLNLMVTSDSDFFRRFVAATELAKRWNVTEKDRRIELFQAVLYGNATEVASAGRKAG